MAEESLRDLVVSLSLDSDNFTRNIKSLNGVIREAESEFNTASTGVNNFGNTQEGVSAKITQLKTQLDAQQKIVEQTQKAYDQAKAKLEANKATYDQLGVSLNAAKEKQASLTVSVDNAKSKYESLKQSLGENAEETQKAKEEYEDLQQQLTQSSEEVEKLEGQIKAEAKALQSNADSVTSWKTKLNNAKGEVANTESELQKMENKLKALPWENASKQLEQFAEKCKSASEACEKVGKGLSVAVTTPVVAAATAATTTFIGFDDAMRQVQATMGLVSGSSKEADQNIELLTTTAKEMGASTRYSASEAAEALNYLALAGYDADSACEALPVVLNLAQAGGIDLATASDMATDAMAALGLEMSELEGFTDEMAVTAQKSNTSVAQLGEAILTVGGTAKNMAGGTAEMNAALGVLANRGIKGAEGGTHLRNILLSLSSPTDKAAAELKALGVSVYDSSGKLRSIDDIFQDLNRSMSSMTDAQKQNVLSTIFNKTDLSSAQALLAGCGDEFQSLMKNIKGSKGAAKQMASTMEGGLGGSIRNLKSAVEGLAIAFGEQLAPTITDFVNKATEVVRWFTSLDDGTKQLIVRFAAFAAAVGPVSVGIGKVIGFVGKVSSALATFTGAVATAGGGLTGLVTVLAASPAAWIAVGVAAAAAVKGVYDFVTGANKAKKAIEEMNAVAKNWQTNAANNMYSGDGMKSFGLDTEDFTNSTYKSLSKWLGMIEDEFSQKTKRTKAQVEKYTSAFSGMKQEISSQITTLRDTAVEQGYSQLGAQMDKDLAQLDKYEKNITRLLEKRRNGTLTDKERKSLEESVNGVNEIQVKYQLVPDGGDGYQQIEDQLKAEQARRSALGESMTTADYGNALKAAAEGYGAVKQAADEAYQSEYQTIQLLDDEKVGVDGLTDRQRAQADLDARYTAERQKALEDYKQTVAEIASMSDGALDFTEQNQQITDLISKMEVWNNAAEGAEKNNAMQGIADAMNSLDPSQIESYIAYLTQLQDLVNSGVMTETEANELLGFDLSDALTQIQEVSGFASTAKDTLGDASKIFTEMIPEDMQEITIGLNLDNATAQWAEFAANPGSDVFATVEIDKTNLDGADPVIVRGTIELSGYDAVTYAKYVSGQEFTINSVCRFAKSGLTLDTLKEADPETYSFVIDGVTIPVDAMTDADWQKLGPNDFVATDTDGKIHIIVVPEVQGTAESVNGASDILSDSGELSFFNTINSSAENVALLNDRLVETKDLFAEIGETPVFDGVSGFLDDNDVQNMSIFAQELAAASANLGEGEVLQISPEALENARQMVELVQNLSDVDTDGEGQAILDKIWSDMQAAGAQGTEGATVAENIMNTINQAIGDDSTAVGTDASAGIGQGMTAYDFTAEAGTTEKNVEDSERTAFDSHSPAQTMVPIGNDVAAGLGQGIAGYTFETEGPTVVTNITASLNGAMKGGSITEVGRTAMASLGTAMASYSFASTASKVASNIRSALQNKVSYSQFRSIGKNAMAGLEQGIKDGTAGVVEQIEKAAEKAVKAAKEKLKIESPSRVFRDEVGVMVMRGMGEGIQQELPEQEYIIRNAAGYLTKEAQSTVTNTTADNRRTYNQNSNFNVTQNIYADSTSYAEQQRQAAKSFRDIARRI